MFEGIGGAGALKRSHDLVKGRWWGTFGALLVGILLVIAVSVVVGLLLGAIASSSSVNVVLTLSGVSRILSAIITYPVVAALSTVIYVDLRARKEGVQLHDVVHGGSPVAAQPTPDIGLS
jgi:ABC-type dipeptide/oligopeptide/nickel transport system permease subunit